MRTAPLRSAAVLSVALLFSNASAQTCSNFSQLNTTLLWDNFTRIEIGFDCPALNGSSADIPLAIHWHITPIAGANLSVSVNVQGLLTASVQGGVLSFEYGEAIHWNGGPAGVEIVCPAGNLTTVSTNGVGHSIEVIDDSGSLKMLEDSGVNNSFYVTTTSGIQYASDSVNGKAQIDAPSINVKMGGVDGDARVKGNVTAQLSGVGNKLVVAGNVTATATGVNSELLVTGGCDSFSDEGVDNTCQATDMTVMVTGVECVGPKGTATCSNIVVFSTSSAMRASLAMRGVVLAFATVLVSVLF